MAYHTILYLSIFLPAALIAYQVVPQKWRSKVLLVFSYIFFFILSKKLIVYLMGTTLLTFYIGMWLARLKRQAGLAKAERSKQEIKLIREKYKRKEKSVLVLGIVILVAVLLYSKYYNFFIYNINALADSVNLNLAFTAKKLLIPIGISFYTLQAIGYMVDVYWGRIPAENKLGRLALFLSFFPQIMEGPICNYSDTAEQLYRGEGLKADNLLRGSIRILWGLFKKMLIADRLYLLVSTVFDQYEQYSGMVVVAAAIAYTIQLYMEFSGSMDMIIGSGKMFGITLPENFRQPFFSKNASDFWRRWHITLGTWFKNYIFYPISASRLVKKWNKFGKKHAGKYITRLVTSAAALLPVWMCNGIWHGPRWNYIFYGIYYFIIILTGIALEPVRARIIRFCRINEQSHYFKILQILKTWLVIFTGELFFRAHGFRTGLQMFFSIFRNFQLKTIWDGTLLSLGLKGTDFLVILLGCLTVAIIEIMEERQIPVMDKLTGAPLPLRWGLYYTLIFAIIILGAYGTGYQVVDLIYAGF